MSVCNKCCGHTVIASFHRWLHTLHILKNKWSDSSFLVSRITLYLFIIISPSIRHFLAPKKALINSLMISLVCFLFPAISATLFSLVYITVFVSCVAVSDNNHIQHGPMSALGVVTRPINTRGSHRQHVSFPQSPLGVWEGSSELTTNSDNYIVRCRWLSSCVDLYVWLMYSKRIR